MSESQPFLQCPEGPPLIRESMAIGKSDLEVAEARMRDRRAGLRAVAARYDRRSSRLVVAFDMGAELKVPVGQIQGLSGAAPAELASIEISPSGLGLHFPRLDVDLYLPGLLADVFGSRHWAAGVLGKTGGASTSQAKARAARANGRLGGRPRRQAET